MDYNFDEIVNRKGTNSLKYDGAAVRNRPEGLLPMWVADMDFPAPPCVLDGLRKINDAGVFGYTEPGEAYYKAVSAWFESRYGFRASQRETVIAPGVVFALAQMVKAFTSPGDAVVIQTPVYYPFYGVIRDNGRKIAPNLLVYANGRYEMDFDGFESEIIQNSVKMFILCNPHNPVGRVWGRGELERLNDICERHGVIVVSDEIHCDFVWGGHKHTCFGLLNENAVIATAPSKTFNLAGLQTANIFIKNEVLREKLIKEIESSGYSQLGIMAIAACQSAYEKGADWLGALKAYIEGNIRSAREFLQSRLPKISLAETEGTYLLWMDFKAYGLTQAELDSRVVNGAKLWLDGGTMFGREGAGFQRMNAACPRPVLEEALNRLEKAFAGM